MKKYIYIVMLLMSLAVYGFADTPKAQIPWMDNYNTAIVQASKLQKPLFIYFGGSDWCTVCQTMQNEILENQDFIAQVSDSFIFYKADFPIYKCLPDDMKRQNEELKKQFHIESFPTIILLDSSAKPFAILNYSSGGGKAYGAYITKLLEDHKKFEESFKNIHNLTMDDLEWLYDYASQKNLQNDKAAILAQALAKNPSDFFLKEQYRNLLLDGKINSNEAKEIRSKLLSCDPDNKKKLHYDVAVLDFEALSRKSVDFDVTEQIKPLKDYLETFGQSDQKNSWKIEMTISQVLSNSNDVSGALYYAKSSHIHAPAKDKIQIADAISTLEKNLETIASEDIDEDSSYESLTSLTSEKNLEKSESSPESDESP